MNSLLPVRQPRITMTGITPFDEHAADCDAWFDHRDLSLRRYEEPFQAGGRGMARAAFVVKRAQ